MGPKTSFKRPRVGGGSTSSTSIRPLLTTLEQEKMYEKYFMQRTVVPGMFFNVSFLTKEGFELNNFIKTQDMEKYLCSQTSYSPSTIRAFFTNLEYDEESLEFSSTIRGTKFKFNKDLFTRIVGLSEPSDDTCLLDESLSLITWYNKKAVVSKILGGEYAAHTKIHTKDLTINTNLVFYMVSHVLLSKAGNYSYMSEFEQVIVYCWLTDRVIDYSYLMLKFIIVAHKQANKGLPYASAITRLIKHFDIDPFDDQVIVPKVFNEFNINRMGFTKRNNKWIRKKENEDNPTMDNEASASEQPQADATTTSMIQNLTAMHDTMNTRLNSMHDFLNNRFNNIDSTLNIRLNSIDDTLISLNTRVLSLEQNVSDLSVRLGRFEGVELGDTETEKACDERERSQLREQEAEKLHDEIEQSQQGQQ